MKVLTGVRGKPICAAHRSLDGKLHGHTWTVTAWWLGKPNAVAKQSQLNAVLAPYDHEELGDDVAWGEAIAGLVMTALGCVRVEVARDAEGIYAVAER